MRAHMREAYADDDDDTRARSLVLLTFQMPRTVYQQFVTFVRVVDVGARACVRVSSTRCFDTSEWRRVALRRAGPFVYLPLFSSIAPTRMIDSHRNPRVRRLSLSSRHDHFSHVCPCIARGDKYFPFLLHEFSKIQRTYIRVYFSFGKKVRPTRCTRVESYENDSIRYAPFLSTPTRYRGKRIRCCNVGVITIASIVVAASISETLNVAECVIVVFTTGERDFNVVFSWAQAGPRGYSHDNRTLAPSDAN